MNLGQLTDYCLSKPGAEESFPFGEDTLVFKVNGKMFLLVSVSDEPLSFNAKCDPDWALELRASYDCVVPGYHMNKKHWNTVVIDGALDRKMLQRLIDHSYELVLKTKKK